MSKKKKDPVITWPITRERYRQVLLKMHRQAKRIRKLETESTTMKRYIGGLFLIIDELESFIKKYKTKESAQKTSKK